jgi:hypothetical protein
MEASDRCKKRCSGSDFRERFDVFEKNAICLLAIGARLQGIGVAVVGVLRWIGRANNPNWEWRTEARQRLAAKRIRPPIKAGMLMNDLPTPFLATPFPRAPTPFPRAICTVGILTFSVPRSCGFAVVLARNSARPRQNIAPVPSFRLQRSRPRPGIPIGPPRVGRAAGARPVGNRT